jgi:hypothetical protein
MGVIGRVNSGWARSHRAPACLVARLAYVACMSGCKKPTIDRNGRSKAEPGSMRKAR